MHLVSDEPQTPGPASLRRNWRVHWAPVSPVGEPDPVNRSQEAQGPEGGRTEPDSGLGPELPPLHPGSGRVPRASGPRPAPPPLSNKTRIYCRRGPERRRHGWHRAAPGYAVPAAAARPGPPRADGVPVTAAAAESPAGGRLSARPGLGARVPAREADRQGGGSRARSHTRESARGKGSRGSWAGRQCAHEAWRSRPVSWAWAPGCGVDGEAGTALGALSAGCAGRARGVCRPH